MWNGAAATLKPNPTTSSPIPIFSIGESSAPAVSIAAAMSANRVAPATP